MKFTVKFKTLGMTLVAGEAALMNVARFNRPDHQVEWLTVHK